MLAQAQSRRHPREPRRRQQRLGLPLLIRRQQKLRTKHDRLTRAVLPIESELVIGRVPILLFSVLLALVASNARGQAPDQPSILAQSLFDRARALMTEGNFAEACPLLAESQRLDPGGGTLINLAVCLEGAGKLATAHAHFHEALSIAIADRRDDRRKMAEERISAIAPRLSKLTITVPPASRVPGIKVWLDGTELQPVAWGVPTAIDGGEHRLEATAPSHTPFVEIVHITAEAQDTEVIILAPKSLFETQLPIQRQPVPTPPSPGPPIPSWRKQDPETRISTASFVVGGASLGALTLGTVTGIAALMLDSAAEDAAFESGCNFERNYCPEGRGFDAIDSAEDAEAVGWVSTVSIGTGAVGFLVALLLPREEVPKTPQETNLVFGWRSIGVRARF